MNNGETMRNKKIRLAILLTVIAIGITATVLHIDEVYGGPQAENVKVETKEPNIYVGSKVCHKYQRIIHQQAKKSNISYPLLLALVEVESGGNAKAISQTNDYGLCQINECNHKWLREKLGIKDFLNPKQNVKACCYMLLRYFKKYPSEPHRVLMAYNLGDSYGSKLWRNGTHSTEYSKKIMKRAREIEKELDDVLL